jgi:formylglycine-generating enzyme required for sulfatase activity
MYLYLRGGSLNNYINDCKVAYQSYGSASDHYYNVGFRLCWRCL